MASVVARHGYDGASVGEIAKAAGLTQGLVHYHFETKLEIFLSLIETLAAKLKERVETHLASATSPRSRLDAFLDAHLALNDTSDPELVACWAVVGAEAVRQERVRQAFTAVIEWELTTLEALVSACLPPDRRDAPATRATAAALFAAIEGYFVLAAASPQSVPPGSAASAVRAMATGLIGN